MRTTLRKTDPTEDNLAIFFEQEYGPLPGNQNVRGLAEGVDPVFLVFGFLKKYCGLFISKSSIVSK